MVATAGIEAGRRALLVERDALDRLAESLDASFDRAIDTIIGAEGRVVVSGIGKSGHVARKIAATLASTGTAALFVHPAEASHGDLGMIHRQDVVLALSNSGNTAELADVISYTRRFAIPLIGITSRAPSTLADQCDVVLLLPPAQEACPTGLAPTTSTTMQMALGDALAVALMHRRGFSSDDFRVLHPGGSLGTKLIRVQDLMHAAAELPLVDPQTRMDEAILEMSRVGFGCVGVVDGDRRLVGVITDGDLRRHMSAGLLGQTAGQVMTPGPRTIRPAALAAEALGLMNRFKVTSLFVTTEDRPVGILRVHDCLRAGLS